jgi:DNA polymerase phi
MATTLPLFWNLASTSKRERVDASVALVSALQQFQTNFHANRPSEASDEDEAMTSNELDVLNAPDVSYSVRRLVRGLASPRESSRLGFAVILTEVCDQLSLLLSVDSAWTASIAARNDNLLPDNGTHL